MNEPMTPTNPPPSPDGAKHTPTPWRFGDGPKALRSSRIMGANGHCVGDIYGAINHGSDDEAAFIVEACNAHDYLKTQVAELNGRRAKLLIEAARAAEDHSASLLRLEKENEMLVEALKRIASYDAPDAHAMIQIARAALSKASGGKA